MKCEFCNKEFSRQSTLTVHLRTCKSNPNRKINRCSCGAEINGKKTLCSSCQRKLDRENATFVSCEEELKNIKWAKFKCVDCGLFDTKEVRGKFTFTCKSCSSKRNHSSFEKEQEAVKKRKQTKLERYGNENYNNLEKIKQTNISKYGKESFVNQEKAKQTKLEKYGDKNYTNREKAKNTMVERYGAFGTFASDELAEKVRQTKLERYGDEKYNNLEKIKQTKLERYGNENYNNLEKNKLTMLEKYGVEHYAQTGLNRPPKYEFDGLYFDSSWEVYYYIYNKYILQNDIKREETKLPYIFNEEEHYYIPDFQINEKFIEIKGPQFFKSGKMINPYDEKQNELYEAKHQCMLKNNVEIITDVSTFKKAVDEKFTSDFVGLFRIGIPFPYLNSELKDISDMGLIHHFHKSIYSASRGGYLSPLQAWQNKNLIKEIAFNRLKYIGRCKPSDILQGFNVTKKAPKVSVFKPKLAATLLEKYSSFDKVFDPFSGFSGRMLGAMKTNKSYEGQDINEEHVRESNEIIKFKNFKNCEVKVQDILTDSNRTFENTTLFTCPPYSSKERWGTENTFKSCDEWIDICLEKYDCPEYLFVVDETSKYENFVVEEIDNNSHFGHNKEKVVLIRK